MNDEIKTTEIQPEPIETKASDETTCYAAARALGRLLIEKLRYFAGISKRTQTGFSSRVINTPAIQSAALSGSIGDGAGGLYEERDSPASESRIMPELGSVRTRSESEKLLTTPPSESTSTSGDRKYTSSDVSFNRHPVSNILAKSAGESMFLGFLRHHDEAQAIKLAQICGFDISRFYPTRPTVNSIS